MKSTLKRHIVSSRREAVMRVLHDATQPITLGQIAYAVGAPHAPHEVDEILLLLLAEGQILSGRRMGDPQTRYMIYDEPQPTAAERNERIDIMLVLAFAVGSALLYYLFGWGGVELSEIVTAWWK